MAASNSRVDGGRQMGVRERVLLHKAKWLASGAAGAILACESASCVCDPLPPPLQCPQKSGGLVNASRYARADATWHVPDGGVASIVIEVTLYQPKDRTFAFLNQTPVVAGGMLQGQAAFNGQTATFSIVPAEGVDNIAVQLATQCDAEQAGLYFTLQSSSMREDGAQVATSLGY
jgi:hypothetical protein